MSPACVAEAATYSVSPQGSDTNEGSTAKPWRTLAHAASAVAPGDTVIVEPGIYREVVTFNRGGTPSSMVTFQSRRVGEAKIVGSGYSALLVRANYMVFSGFDVDANEGHGFDLEGVHHVVIKNNIAHDCGGSGISSSASEYLTVTGNTCYANSRTNGYQTSGISLYNCRPLSDAKPGFHIIVSQNLCYDNGESAAITAPHTDGNGIIIDDFHNEQGNFKQYPFAGQNYPYATLVENNVCYHNGGKGIQVFISDHVTVRNNTVYWNNWDTLNTGTWRGEINLQNTADTICSNNIAVANPAYHPSNTALLVASSGGFNDSTTKLFLNLTFNGSPGNPSLSKYSTQATVSLTNSKLGFDPLFVNANLTRPDFKLRPNSPAIRSGSRGGSTDAAAVDFLGVRRPSGQPIDLGAYQSSSRPDGRQTVSAMTKDR